MNKIDKVSKTNSNNQTNQTLRIWYPGSFYADKPWIDYLKNKFDGEWCFSDIQASKPEWAEFMPDAQYITEFDTLSNEALRFQKQFKPNIIILSLHPGLHEFSDIQNLIDNFTELPDIIVYCDLRTADINLNGYILNEELVRPGCFVVEYKLINWIEKELIYNDLRKIKCIKFSKSEKSWIDFYHQGTPAFRIESGYFNGQCYDNLLKFNIFCFSKNVLKEITPLGFRLPNEHDWKNIINTQSIIDKIMPNKYNGEHHSYLFFSLDGHGDSDKNLINKPDKIRFIRDLDRTVFFSFDNIVLNKSNELELRKIIDFAGYPRFMMKFIK
jgi:hypothetical protein